MHHVVVGIVVRQYNPLQGDIRNIVHREHADKPNVGYLFAATTTKVEMLDFAASRAVADHGERPPRTGTLRTADHDGFCARPGHIQSIPKDQ